MTHFEKPVLDIEKLGRRRPAEVTVDDNEDYSLNRGGANNNGLVIDISEEMLFSNGVEDHLGSKNNSEVPSGKAFLDRTNSIASADGLMLNS